ncbi:GNAT family N-acetyltransferase [Saccharopolyspora sp. NPDC047091]|uniref:GNAT family N-acetyltransferase n=1 Tax=Saccharopolyspora sp. NPDC047091 TaxID=3155924 RepID=UPI0033F6D75D
MRVRSARHDDERALARIVRAAWTPESSVFPRPAADAPFFREPVVPENVLVALATDEPIGLIKLVPMAAAQPRLGVAAAHVQQIYGLSVAPEHQGGGAGTELLGAARAEAVARGARRITMRVLGSNARAQRLYERLGYRVEGVEREQFLLGGAYVDDVLLALDLT